MNNMLKMGLLTVGIGAALLSADANAVLAGHSTLSNAVNYCQAFTPGVANTIRNRVIGSENIGSPIAFACNFASHFNGAPGNTNLRVIEAFFSNGGTATASVTCTMLTGAASGIGAGAQYAVTRTSTPITPNTAAVITFTQADNPTPGSADFGSPLVGINCRLPTNMTMSGIVLRWTADNGVGS